MTMVPISAGNRTAAGMTHSTPLITYHQPMMEMLGGLDGPSPGSATRANASRVDCLLNNTSHQTAISSGTAYTPAITHRIVDATPAGAFSVGGGTKVVATPATKLTPPMMPANTRIEVRAHARMRSSPSPVAMPSAASATQMRPTVNATRPRFTGGG